MNMYIMRDMYNNIPGYSADELSPEDDPFYDPAPWFQFIGRSYVYLQNVLHNIPLTHTTPVFSEKAEIRAYLNVQIVPYVKQKDQSEQSENEETSKYTLVDLGWKDLEEKYTPLIHNSQVEDELQNDEQNDTLPDVVYFNIILKEANGLSSRDYTDVFCQIRFLNDQGITFATNPPCKGNTFYLTCN